MSPISILDAKHPRFRSIYDTESSIFIWSMQYEFVLLTIVVEADDLFFYSSEPFQFTRDGL